MSKPETPTYYGFQCRATSKRRVLGPTGGLVPDLASVHANAPGEVLGSAMEGMAAEKKPPGATSRAAVSFGRFSPAFLGIPSFSILNPGSRIFLERLWKRRENGRFCKERWLKIMGNQPLEPRGLPFLSTPQKSASQSHFHLPGPANYPTTNWLLPRFQVCQR